MDSNEKSLIEVKEPLWKKLVNSVRSFFSNVFSKKTELIEESINEEENELTMAELTEVESIKEENKEEISYQEKLDGLVKENRELVKIFDEKLEELKKARIKELKVTLEIYKLEELYLRKIKNERVTE
jgi:hypothetical protein